MKTIMTILTAVILLTLTVGRGQTEDIKPDSSDDALPWAAAKTTNSGVPAQAVDSRGGRGLVAGPRGNGGPRGGQGAGWGRGRGGRGGSGRAVTDEGPGRGRGRGWGGGRGFGPGPGGWRRGADPSFEADHDIIHYLVEHRQEIERQVRPLSNGIRTITESDNPQVATKIQQHVHAMVARVEGGRPIRMRDPLFAAVFHNADKIHVEVETTNKGVKVKETSDDPFVATLLKAHARVVSLFLENGWSEMPKNHAAPDEPN